MRTRRPLKVPRVGARAAPRTGPGTLPRRGLAVLAAGLLLAALAGCTAASLPGPSAFCQAGQVRCSGDGRAVLRCSADGHAWQALDECAAGERCEGGRCIADGQADAADADADAADPADTDAVTTDQPTHETAHPDQAVQPPTDGAGDTPACTGLPACPSAGVCAEASVARCGETGWSCDFSAVAGYEAEPETSCDGRDNDCDGEIDEHGCGLCTPGAGVGCEGNRVRLVCSADGRTLDTESCPPATVCQGRGACNVASTVRANEVGYGDQCCPAVTALAGGGLVILWVSPYEDEGGLAVVGRRFADWGVALGGNFAVPATRQGDQAEPAVAATANGGFVAVWRGPAAPPGQVGAEHGAVFARGFDAAGEPLQPDDVRLSSGADPATEPRVALSASHGLAVWTSTPAAGGASDVWLRALAADAQPLRGAERLRDGSSGTATAPDVVRLTDERFLATWTEGDGTADARVVARVFDLAIPAATASVVLSNDAEGRISDRPAPLATADGTALVAWVHETPGGDWELRARRLTDAGTPAEPPFALVATARTPLTAPALGLQAPGGAFVAAWEWRSADAPTAVYRVFTAQGVPQADVTLVLDTPVDAGHSPLPLTLPDGRLAFVVAADVGGDGRIVLRLGLWP